MTKRQRFNSEEKAAALNLLAMNDGNVLRTARELGISNQTLISWRDSAGTDLQTAVATKRKDLVNLLETHIHETLEAMGTTRKDASYAALSNSLTTLIDKWRLLQGLPTQIVEIMPSLVTAAKTANVDLVVFLNTALDKMRALPAASPNLLNANNVNTNGTFLPSDANADAVDAEYDEV